jgi:predicted RND superfamily exporter protein
MKCERFFIWLLNHRGLTLATLTGLILTVAYGARHVWIDYGVEQFFLEWGQERDTYEEYKRLFPREDTRVSFFWKDRRGFSTELYRDMERVATWFESSGLANIRWLGSVMVAEQEAIEDETGISVGPLVSPNEATDSGMVAALRLHASDPLFNGILWDTTQTIFLIHGYVKQEENTDPTRRQIESALADSLANFDAAAAELILTGLPIARARAPKLLESDIRVLLSAALVAFALILYWYFRRPAHVILSLASVAPAYLVVLGFLGYIGKPISILTSFIPIIVLVVGMSDAVHILSEYRRRRLSQPQQPAIVSTFAALVGPCFYTSITTAVGFASLAGTRIGIVVDFGVLTAVAILLTFTFSMTAFPVLLSFAPDRPPPNVAAQPRLLETIIAASVARARKPSGRVVLVTAVVAAAGVILASQLRVNTFLIDDTKESAPFMQDIRWMDEHGFGFFQVNVLLRQTGDRPLHSPEALAWMEDLKSFAREEPLVTHVLALPDFFQQLRRAAIGSSADPLPVSVEEASQLLLMAQLQDPAFVEDVYHETLGVAQVIITVRDEGSLILEPFLGRLNAYIEQHPFPVGTQDLTGTVTMIHSFTQRLLRSFGPSILIAIVAITSIMMWMFKSVRLGLVALIPNLLPLIAVLGVTAALGYAIKPSTVLVLSIAFGIAVDDTIHLMSRVAHHSGNGRGITSGLVGGLRDAGAVMVVTTGVVTAGFLILTMSHFEVLFLIGLMTVVSAVTALAADLFVLPSIVGLAESWAPAKEHATTPVKGATS